MNTTISSKNKRMDSENVCGLTNVQTPSIIKRFVAFGKSIEINQPNIYFNDDYSFTGRYILNVAPLPGSLSAVM
jgi:hypothetical protein